MKSTIYTHFCLAHRKRAARTLINICAKPGIESLGTLQAVTGHRRARIEQEIHQTKKMLVDYLLFSPVAACSIS
jgi:hypothetical protein